MSEPMHAVLDLFIVLVMVLLGVLADYVYRLFKDEEPFK